MKKIIILIIFIFLNGCFMTTKQHKKEMSKLSSVLLITIIDLQNKNSMLKKNLLRLKINNEHKIKNLSENLKKVLKKNDYFIKIINNKVVITATNKVLFDTGKTNIKPEAKKSLNKIIKILLKQQNDNFRIIIEGHTDNVPIHNKKFKDNWDLSVGRSMSILRFFLKTDLNPEILSVAGFGKYRPMFSNETKKGKTNNRRIDIIIIPIIEK